jgi:hypothetical protein
VGYKFDSAGWYMVKGKADLLRGSIAAGCAALLIIGFNILRNGYTQCSWTVKSIVICNPKGTRASDMGLGVLLYVF